MIALPLCASCTASTARAWGTPPGRGSSSGICSVPGHEVKAAASGRAFPYLSQYLPDVEEIWGLELRARAGPGRHLEDAHQERPRAARTGFPRTGTTARRSAKGFAPDLVITDFEGFAYLFAQDAPHPRDQSSATSRWSTAARTTPSAAARAAQRDYLAARSFVAAKLPHATTTWSRRSSGRPLRKRRTTLVPSLLRPEILAATPEHGDHLLVYGRISQTSIEALQAERRAGAPVRRARRR